MSLLNFNASEVTPSTVLAPIPAGKYAAIINDSGMRPIKSGSGQYLLLEFEIIEGEYTGRKLWDRLPLEHTNPEAVRIARADLSAVCHAVNVMTPKDSVELHNIPLVIVVKCRKSQDDEMVSEIKGYEAYTQPEPVVAPLPQRHSSLREKFAPAAPVVEPLAQRYAPLREELARQAQQQSAWTQNRSR